MKTKLVIITVTCVIFISFAISTFTSLIFLNRLIRQNNAERARVYTDEVVESIQNTLLESTAVSKEINNPLVRNIIKDHENYTEEELSDLIGGYLRDITRQFGFGTAFLITGHDRTYYTEWGRMKYLDPKNEDDGWYDDFLSTGKDFELNLDNDQANENRATLYVNIRMTDENGEYIGVCGVGHVLDGLNRKIDKLEHANDLSIQLVSKEGIIKVAGDDSLCLQSASDVLRIMMEDADRNGGFFFGQFGMSGFRVSSYLDEYELYLCIGHEDSANELTKILYQELLACIVSFVIMVIIISVAMKAQDRRSLKFKIDSETDKMTGLLNRRAYEDTLFEIRNSKTVKDYSVCMVDINGLKQVNDNLGHEAGDELIIGAASCIKNVFGKNGTLFRIGGDEFAVIFNNPSENAEDCLRRLKGETANWSGVLVERLSVAAGIVCGRDHEELSIDELVMLADKEMYRDKEIFYKNKRNDRRRM